MESCSFRITSKLDVKNYANWIWYHDNWPCLSFSLFGYNFYKSYIRQYEVYGQYGYYLRLIYVWIYELLLCFLLIINKQKLKYIEKLESHIKYWMQIVKKYIWITNIWKLILYTDLQKKKITFIFIIKWETLNRLKSFDRVCQNKWIKKRSYKLLSEIIFVLYFLYYLFFFCSFFSLSWTAKLIIN